MTNKHPVTIPALQARFDEAVEWSNWYFMEQNWQLSEYWHLHAVELLSMLERVRHGSLSQH